LIILAGNLLNYADVLSYETGDWEDMVNYNIVTALEVVAGITEAEKTAYNGL
jgi:NADP-dependent 3-hydroxy acid dehydrogenase YdfG